MSIRVSSDWKTITVRIPPEVLKNFKKKLIDDDVSAGQVLLSMMHAYTLGEIQVDKHPDLKDVPLYRVSLLTEPEEYRVILKTSSGEILNPLPITENG